MANVEGGVGEKSVISDDGQFMWTGDEWIPAPPPTPKNQPITELDESRPDEVIDGPVQEEKITTVLVMESPESMTTQPAKKGYPVKIISSIVIGAILFLSAIVFFLSDSTDEVLIVHSITSSCDETLITWSFADEVFQDRVYKSSTEEYASWIEPAYLGEMADGDVAVAALSATNFDDSQCIIVGNIWVSVDTDGDGDHDDELENLIELDSDEGYLGEYEKIELSGAYVHDK